MRVLLLSLVFAPDSVSTAALLTQLAEQLCRLGHRVSVVTTTPHYNDDPEIRASQPLHPKWGSLLWQSRQGEIPVYHAAVRAKGRRTLGRALDYLVFHVVGTLAGLFAAGRYDVVLAVSPPLTIGLSALALARLRGVPFVYNVQEIYPDVAVDLGVLRPQGTLVRALEAVERFVYRQAAAVVAISPGFERRLLEKGVPARKLSVIENFVDATAMQPGERRNAFSHEHRLDDRFVALYAGNLGLTQDLAAVLEAASLLTDVPEVCLVVAGDGARRAWLEAEVARRRLRNVRLLPYQPSGVVAAMYASSDVCLVPLRAGTARHTFPSKIYTIMAAGRPAIVAADKTSDLAELVAQSACGRAVPPGDAPALAAAIRTAYEHRDAWREMGRHGREYVVAHHSPEAAARAYDALLGAVAPGTTHRRGSPAVPSI